MRYLTKTALLVGALVGLALAQQSEATKLSIKLTDQALQQNRGDPGAFVVNLVRSANAQFLEDVDIRAETAITSVPAAAVDELVTRAVDLDQTYVPVNFNSYFSVILAGKPDAGRRKVAPEDGGQPRREVVDEILKRLLDMPEVESAQPIVQASPPAPVFPDDDPLSKEQGYLNAAPQGIDVRSAWARPGGDGEFASIVDVEWDWKLDHPDLAVANITAIGGPLRPHPDPARYTDHGTNVLGEMFMVDNTVGGIGIAPRARGRVSQINDWDAADGILDAIVLAIKNMEFGDLLLIEVQYPASTTTLGVRQSPIEIYDRYFHVLRLATALGITVIEAGGNGGHDLDLPVSGDWGLTFRSVFNRNHADFRDSGAIIVGGSSKSVPHFRMEGTADNTATNYGNRIDAYAWFEGILSTSLNNHTGYDGNFGGTSGASPIVTGVAAIIQSMLQASLGFKLGPLQMRRLITLSGTSTSNPASDKIGLMPNLRGLIDGQYLNLAPDLYIRDVLDDDGSPRSGNATFASPDIITRQAQVANPTSQFGAGSGQENNDALSQNVLPGRDNFIYVRARNRGSRPAQQSFAEVYWTEAANALNAAEWKLIGRADFPSGVREGNVLTVSNALRWQAPAGVRDPLLIVIAGAEEDPAPLKPTGVIPAEINLSRFCHQNNNVAAKMART